jgi:hypothetical protein
MWGSLSVGSDTRSVGSGQVVHVEAVEWEFFISVITAVNLWVILGGWAEHVTNFDVDLTEQIIGGIRTIHVVNLESGVFSELPELEVLLEVPGWVHTGVCDNVRSYYLVIWWELVLLSVGVSWSFKSHDSEWISLRESIHRLGQMSVLNVDSDSLGVVINASPDHAVVGLSISGAFAKVGSSNLGWALGVPVWVNGTLRILAWITACNWGTSLENLVVVSVLEIGVLSVVNAHAGIIISLASLGSKRLLLQLGMAVVSNVHSPVFIVHEATFVVASPFSETSESSHDSSSSVRTVSLARISPWFPFALA